MSDHDVDFINLNPFTTSVQKQPDNFDEFFMVKEWLVHHSKEKC